MKRLLPYFLPILTGSALLAIPLLRDFHIESAMLAGIIGSYWAGVHSSRYQTKNDFYDSIHILGFLYLAGLPLFINALFTGCLTVDGIGFWVFIPLPGIFLGASIGRLIRKFWIPFPQTLTVIIITILALGVWIIEFFHFPQVFFFNHVWGVWPGPIYDEAVQFSGSFLYFRWLTFLWIILLWMIPNWDKNLQTKIITGFALLSLLFGYLNLDEAGIISPEKRLQKELSGYTSTEHFELYYNEEFFTPEEINYWEARHEFYFREIVEELDVEWPKGRKIHSYLYAHAWQKKKLTGAKFTSYVPIWLEQDQLHIAKSHIQRVLKHEMVHAISKQFGNRLFNGSWKIGLIEGLAEAVAKDASSESTLHQLVAAEEPWPGVDEMKSALSWYGFYAKAGAISYTTTGSFVRYLLDEFPAENLKTAYQGISFEEAYETSFSDLVSGWHQTLGQVVLDSVDKQISAFIFAQLSLFEKQCPHAVSKELNLWDTYQFLLANKDTTQAYEAFDRLYDLEKDNELVKTEWVKAQIKNGHFEQAYNAFTPKDTLLSLRILKADALFLAENFSKADSLLTALAPDIQAAEARNFRHSLELRKDSLQWIRHLKRRYKNDLPDSLDFSQLNRPNQLLTLRMALQNFDENNAKTYSFILSEPILNVWFEVYEESLEKLAFWDDFNLSESICENSSGIDLRLRYQERLNETCRWAAFLKSNNPVAD